MLRLIPASWMLGVVLVAAQTADQPKFFSVPPVDAPELAPRGPHSVGVRTLNMSNPSQVDILSFDKATGKAPLYDRPLTVEVWYPASIPDGKVERTSYEMALPGNDEGSIAIAGKALRDAPPVKQKFPLVVVSHGYPGSRFFLSYLTENLASKGYVVAAIDHTDSVFGSVKAFSSTLLNRAADQLFVVGELEKLAGSSGNFLSGLVDDSKVAVLGYSMGGYGALTTAGAGYNSASAIMGIVPGNYMSNWLAGNSAYKAKLRPEIKAVIAIAPWGAQPPYNAWDAGGLEAIHIPMLMIAGDQDDVSDFSAGITPAFDKSVNSARCLLVYENARHNVGGNPPPGMEMSFSTREAFDEPVWRKDRITAINQHFITAFLDLYLKNESSRAAYLHVSPERSSAGTWPLPQGQSVGAKFSNGDHYWKGFQRRWAVGLQMHCIEPSGK